MNVENIITILNNTWPKLLFTIIVFIIGIVIAKLIVKFIKKSLKKSRIEPTYHTFFVSLFKILLYIIVLFISLSTLGVSTASLVTIFGAASLALSLAVKDTLSNLAGGFLILFSRPFIVGDYIESDGIAGTVKGISILYTRLNTPDNKSVFIPNGQLSGAVIVNYSKEKLRRIDLNFPVTYDNDILDIKLILQKIVEQNPLSLKEPLPIIRVNEHKNNYLNFVVKVWVENENYWDLYYDIQEQVKIEFEKANIKLPYSNINIVDR